MDGKGNSIVSYSIFQESAYLNHGTFFSLGLVWIGGSSPVSTVDFLSQFLLYSEICDVKMTGIKKGVTGRPLTTNQRRQLDLNTAVFLPISENVMSSYTLTIYEASTAVYKGLFEGQKYSMNHKQPWRYISSKKYKTHTKEPGFEPATTQAH